MCKDQPQTDQVLKIISELVKAAEYMNRCAESRKFEQLEESATNMIQTLQTLAYEIKQENAFISVPVSCENLIYSINNILKLVKTRSEKICSKIEFELIPILQDFYYDFYFFTSIFGNKEKEKKHYQEEFVTMTRNSYIDQSMKTGKYKYDVSIAVFAYNKLEYTKQCVESIIKNTPSYINYELILIDNGSNDGTYEYFESLSPTKTFKLKLNSLNMVFGAVSRIYEGRYILLISNDIVVTENYLDNLIKCIESDPKIAMVVPTTPNISNCQTIPVKYSTFDEMNAFAKANNISNPIRWEERTRLCNPVSFYRSDTVISSKGVGVIDKYFIYSEFSDDAVSLRLRRAGYKLILAKDCYCHHFGSVTLREAQIKENTLGKSRKLFIDRYGVDAWNIGFCYDPKFIEVLTVKEKGRVNVLGINSGFGSNSLKIKTLHREVGNQETELFFVTDDERYVPDLQAYSTNVRHVSEITADIFKDISFDYILLEANVKKIISTADNFNKMKEKVNKGGMLAICATSPEDIEILDRLNADKSIDGNNGHWFIWTS
ncbi:glycosyltransferase [Clostridium thailandense]|uniref:glycosyltransferase n=1 Tax=Clostridium thailandense TaxID=2794346 RepID=UPI003989D1B7